MMERIDGSGFRLTDPRRLVVQAVCRRSGPFSADEIHDELRAEGHGIGRATVFRTLDLLFGLRLLDRVHRPDGSHGYVINHAAHQHHVVCSRCGAVTEFSGCNVDELIDVVAERTRYRIDGHWLELYGVCQRCQNASHAA